MTATAERTRCANRIMTGARLRPCNRFAKQGDPDGWCGHCRHTYGTPAPEYTCTACWRIVRRGVDGGLCTEHTDRPKDPRYT